MAATLYGATSSDAFRLARLEVTGPGRASETEVVAAIRRAVGERPNLFRIRSAELETAVTSLPPVLAAHVRVILPDRLVVAVEERRPILVWVHGEVRLLADAEGALFAQAEGPGASTLPVVEDRRAGGETPRVGDRLDPTDLAVARQLGVLTAASLASRATSFDLAVDDRDGWTLLAGGVGWRAIFGVYAARIRTPDVVPAQVQCLAAIVAAEEARLSVAYLAPARDRCGTYRLRTDT
jgi:cell division septal protein FtsQ